MTNGYVIEIDEVAAGLLIPEGASYAFHTVDRRYRALDGVVFSGPHAAERAARRLHRPATPASHRTAGAARAPEDEGWAGSMLSGAFAGGIEPPTSLSWN